MKRMILLAAVGMLLLTGCGTGEKSQNKILLNGAGATFPSPVYASWTYNYSQANTDGVQVNYQGVGSGAGVQQLREGTVDFAGTDKPLSEEELQKDGLVQFPMLGGGVVVVVNVPGVKNNEIQIPSEILADIFLGDIQKWNDPALTQANPGVVLPDLKIVPVYRADSSGTSFLFTSYLAKVSGKWSEKVGAGPAVRFPVGVGGQKNPGVCNNVAKISGSIGYTEYTYAVETGLACVQLQDGAGTFVKPESATFSESLADPNTGWPITGVTYLVYSKTLDPAKLAAFRKYVSWCFTDGKSRAVELNYVPVKNSQL